MRGAGRRWGLRAEVRSRAEAEWWRPDGAARRPGEEPRTPGGALGAAGVGDRHGGSIAPVEEAASVARQTASDPAASSAGAGAGFFSAGCPCPGRDPHARVRAPYRHEPCRLQVPEIASGALSVQRGHLEQSIHVFRPETRCAESESLLRIRAAQYIPHGLATRLQGLNVPHRHSAIQSPTAKYMT